MMRSFNIFPVGEVRKKSGKPKIIIYNKYKDALLGLEEFSHMIVLVFFHRTDASKQRGRLRVHPRGNKGLPLTGVFGTRSPVRPNPIAISVCEIVSMENDVVGVDEIDALDGSPVLDIKPYIPATDSKPQARVPEWIRSAD